VTIGTTRTPSPSPHRGHYADVGASCAEVLPDASKTILKAPGTGSLSDDRGSRYADRYPVVIGLTGRDATSATDIGPGAPAAAALRHPCVNG